MKFFIEIITTINVASLLFIAGVHIYWAFGGKWFIEHVIPKTEGKPAFEPGVFITLMVALILTIVALLNIAMVYLSIGTSPLIEVSLLAFAILFAIRGIGDFNKVGLFQRRSTSTFSFYDRRVYSPWVLLMSINMFLIYFF